jgi:hypothetical protein
MVSKPKGTQTQITSYYDAESVQRLKELSDRTRVPQAAYLREGLSDLLSKWGWHKSIPGCFGLMDVQFGIHPSDLARAKATIKEARQSGATFEDFEKQIVWHCYKNWTADGQQKHTAAQVARAKKMWGK